MHKAVEDTDNNIAPLAMFNLGRISCTLSAWLLNIAAIAIKHV